MENILTVNGTPYRIKALLGKGKGGYSYLAQREGREYVLKQIHHEPCDYYQFGDKLASELADYETLQALGLPLPRLLAVDKEQERILKEYIPGPTVYSLVAQNALPPFCRRQMEEMCALLYPAGLNIDYFPTNFVLWGQKLFYIDYECNPYEEKWDFEHWGAQYWEQSEAFLRHREEEENHG